VYYAGRVLDVDRLAKVEGADVQDGAGTKTGTSGGSRGEVVEFSGVGWGECANDFRAFLLSQSELPCLELVSG
jgi:hypothetical protein